MILMSASAANGSFLRFEVGCADAQRELVVFRSEVKRGGGEVPVRFKVVRCETQTGNAPAVLGHRGRMGVFVPQSRQIGRRRGPYSATVDLTLA